MTEAPAKPMSWGMIIGIMVAVGLVTGVLMGGLVAAFDLSKTLATSGVGAAIGVSGSLLIARRSAQLKKQKPP